MIRLLTVALAAVLTVGLAQPAIADTSRAGCAALSSLRLSDTAITTAEVITAREAVALKLPANLPAFCRVVAHVSSAPDSDIGMELWLPVEGWTGIFHGNGNGGFAGTLPAGYNTMIAGLRRGFATAVTDTGTAPATSLDGDALIGHPRKWKDWGRLSTHVMTVTAKTIAQAYYGRAARRSYYTGCSTGGQQGLIEALYYPADYDGILVGAPVINRTWGHAAVAWDFAAAHRTAASFLSDAKLHLLNAAAVRSCNLRGHGAVGDAFISNPLACRFDPAEIACSGADTAQCLTPPEVATARAFYSGPMRRDGRPAFYGWLPGSEAPAIFGWSFLQTANDGAPQFASVFRWVFGSDWNWRSFDVDRDMAVIDRVLGPDVNDATRGSLSAFAARGGKLIIYHGMADALVPPAQSVDFYKRQTRAAVNIARLQKSARLFMVPGFMHCFGGPGADAFNSAMSGLPQPPQPGPTHDLFAALIDWRERGQAPDRVIATRYVADGKSIAFQRPLCAYPRMPAHTGDNATSVGGFSCR